MAEENMLLLVPDRGALALDFQLPTADSLGALLDAGSKLYFSNLWMIAKVVLPVWLPLRLVVNYGLYSAGKQNSFQAMTADLWLEILISAFLAPAVIYALVERMHYRQPTLLRCYDWGIRKSWRMLRAWILVALASFLGLLLFVIPGIIIAVMYSFVGEIVSVEKEPAEGVLNRSQQLTAGIRLRLFVAWLIALSLLAVLVLFAFMPLAVIDHWLLATLGDTVSEVGYSFVACVLLVAYLDRVRVERLAAAGSAVKAVL